MLLAMVRSELCTSIADMCEAAVTLDIASSCAPPCADEIGEASCGVMMAIAAQACGGQGSSPSCTGCANADVQAKCAKSCDGTLLPGEIGGGQVRRTCPDGTPYLNLGGNPKLNGNIEAVAGLTKLTWLI